MDGQAAVCRRPQPPSEAWLATLQFPGVPGNVPWRVVSPTHRSSSRNSPHSPARVHTDTHHTDTHHTHHTHTTHIHTPHITHQRPHTYTPHTSRTKDHTHTHHTHHTDTHTTQIYTTHTTHIHTIHYTHHTHTERIAHTPRCRAFPQPRGRGTGPEPSDPGPVTTLPRRLCCTHVRRAPPHGALRPGAPARRKGSWELWASVTRMRASRSAPRAILCGSGLSVGGGSVRHSGPSSVRRSAPHLCATLATLSSGRPSPRPGRPARTREA